MNRLADHDGDRTKSQLSSAAGQSLCAPKIRIGTTGARVFAMTNPTPVNARLQIAVERAAPFRENENALFCAQECE